MTLAAAYGDSSRIHVVVTVDVAGRVTAAATVAIAAAIPAPQGRLTLASATPVLTGDVTGASTIYYDCYAGRFVPYDTGSADAVDAIGACEVSTVLKASGTGVESNNDLFDVFWAHAAGTICVATNGSGGGWSADTGGSLTARGSGYSDIHNTRGYWTNGQALAHCYNGATDEGSIATDQATYLRHLRSTTASARPDTRCSSPPPARAEGAIPSWASTMRIIGFWSARSTRTASRPGRKVDRPGTPSTPAPPAGSRMGRRPGAVTGAGRVFDQTRRWHGDQLGSGSVLGVDLDSANRLADFPSQQIQWDGESGTSPWCIGLTARPPPSTLS